MSLRNFKVLKRSKLLGEVNFNAEPSGPASNPITKPTNSPATGSNSYINCQSGTWDNVTALYRINSTLELGVLDRELINALPSTLKYICLNVAGYDGMNIDACTEREIWASKTPKVVAEATADVAMLLMFGTLENGKADTPLGRDSEGKGLGILGMADIGLTIAHRARAFGMSIVYHNRPRLLEDKEVKDDVVIINTARGSLLDEAAFVEALQAGKVASAGSDVFENEPVRMPRKKGKLLTPIPEQERSKF
ncbi:hypothetical protein BDV23DRAFT_175843 [Aspergillus alliaceus]|uniref:D-isomer specific 2-hydroxyacid dehydrogenase NAD-binding domain-containing protein n=1 Tax=Petromyces alliaceus TaxID=209559 RepID=A0A5N7BVR5_PETAA|nr:hypothetical protein BDV23DRAFT_175843 [Aspergillus alliaceus]